MHGGLTQDLGITGQIQNDLMDVLGDESKQGKPVGCDRRNGHTTFVDLLGTEQTEAHKQRHGGLALQALSPLRRGDGDNTTLFEELVEYCMKRDS